jgi:hypothetical protein
MQCHSCIVTGSSGADVGWGNRRDPWVAVPWSKQGGRNIMATAPLQQGAAWLEKFGESHRLIETLASRPQQFAGPAISSHQPLLAVHGDENAEFLGPQNPAMNDISPLY